jgi:ferredoxin
MLIAELQITVDREKCSGEAICVDIAPEVFQLDEEGIAEVINPAGADRDIIIEAAQSCPQGAVTVVETGTGEQLVP